jgi:hypothetical protein
MVQDKVGSDLTLSVANMGPVRVKVGSIHWKRTSFILGKKPMQTLRLSKVLKGLGGSVEYEQNVKRS